MNKRDMARILDAFTDQDVADQMRAQHGLKLRNPKNKAPLNVENDILTGGSRALTDTVFAHSESPNPLIEEDLNVDPTPLPVPPPENAPDAKGICGMTGRQRAPKADEFITDDGFIKPRALWVPKKRRRGIPSLSTTEDVRKEMARLYADYHHRRITGAEFTKAAYALDCLARITRMAAKG